MFCPHCGKTQIASQTPKKPPETPKLANNEAMEAMFEQMMGSIEALHDKLDRLLANKVQDKENLPY